MCCCQTKLCYIKINAEEQEKFFDEFWFLGNYNLQNYYLKHLLKYKSSKKINACHKHRLLEWEYKFPKPDINEDICLKFFLQLLQVSERRFRTIKEKIVNNEHLNDKRGLYVHFKILTSPLMKLIRKHCDSLPHHKSHYKLERTSLNYFDDSSLNLKKMYILFLDFYAAETGDDNIPLKEKTYINFFNYNINYSFTLPRTDMCDFCYECQLLDTENSEEYKKHVEEYKSYYELKNKYLAEKRALCIEFDFAQNLPLPKLPVNKQYYSRLLWLFAFNVHIFDIYNKENNADKDTSYVYFLLEGFAKKGSNSVINFVLDAILKEFDPQKHDKIFLFSDGCGGQNKNYLFLHFFASLAKKLGVPIEHVFPVVGHSYNQCDRNFGLYSKKKKDLEAIESVEQYSNLIKTSRNPPFKIIQDDEYDILDFEKSFKTLPLQKQKEIKISQKKRLSYKPNGDVFTYNSYDHISIEHKLTLIDFDSIVKEKTNFIGVNKDKIENLKDLVRFLKSENRLLLLNYLDKVSVKEIQQNVVKKKNDLNYWCELIFLIQKHIF